MIKIHKKEFKKGNRKLGIPNGGGIFYHLRYRKGDMFFEDYPDRSKMTHSPFLKRCYQLDDQLEFFLATNKTNFNKNRELLVNEALEFANEMKNEAEQYPVDGMPYHIYNKRAECVIHWAEEMLSVQYNRKWPAERNIRRLKKKRLKLK